MSINHSIEARCREIFDRLAHCGELERLVAAVRLPRDKSALPAGTVVVSGLSGSARAFLVAAIEKKLRRRIVFITRSNRELEEFQTDLEFFYSGMNGGGEEAAYESKVVVIPAPEADPYDGTSPHAEVLEQRALALYRTACAAGGGAEPPRIVITTLRAVAERTVPPQSVRTSGIALADGDEMPLELIVDLLISSGYVREEPVGAVGEFSLRGGILDVFSPAHSAPRRLEFFGDSVESIREFDPDTQRSVSRVARVVIAPMRELTVRREEFLAWADAADARWQHERFKRDLRERLAHAQRGEPFPGWEYLIPLTRSLTSSVFDHFKDALLVIDEPAEIENAAADMYAYLATRYGQADDAGELALPPEELFLTPSELLAKFEASARVELRLLGTTAAAVDERFRIESLMLEDVAALAQTPTGPGEIAKAFESTQNAIASSQPAPNAGQLAPDTGAGAPDGGAKSPRAGASVPRVFLFPLERNPTEISLISQAPRRYHGRLQDLARDLQPESEGGKTTLFVVPSSGLAERIREMLAEYDVTADVVRIEDLSASQSGEPERRTRGPVVTVGRLSNGFALPAIELCVLVESDIFGDVERVTRQRAGAARARKQRSIEAFLSDLGDLKVGDYVVHIDHGIGQFQRLEQIPVTGGTASGTFNVAEGIGRGATMREFMLITYAGGAKLYVPVERFDLIQRYSAGEGHKPELDRLGGVGWQKTKARARRALRDMAEELLKLYAERKLVGGYACGADTPWQAEFEDTFEYQLTPDQETAVEDVKSDMERPQPMDRLVVGDVGYGKTEVAMRAAFKSVMEGKQVAVLSPTTVLAYQHFKTFQQRFSAFPVRLEMLSRFRTAREQKEVVKATESGAIDIVIGTHRLLSKDVGFKDLGLLVVDEEQRFGVAHKERIKQMRKKVDVVSMSATPIPRTLNMSLAGLRDMSVIETPPRDRLAIQTHVVQFSEPVVRSAIELELQRGGQVFFVHNRVETIHAIAELISRLVPTARIGVGHGQMDEKELEDVMLKFIHHELDLLVSTTIIENGIDIPLANTIIVNRADAYGLSQLYQLRGRVGRSNRRAYAYLLIPSEDSLTQVARRRLAAIREFSDLGAGFRIAALDLELRGAGNLLGREQSGHIDAIGFDLYTQMLERSVRELKGDPIEGEASTAINLGLDIRITQDYIFDMSQRLRVYKRVSSAENEAELSDIRGEIEDRYGPIPESAENLFEYARLRREASHLGILSIDREGDRLAIKFAESAPLDADKLIALVNCGDASFSPARVLKVVLTSRDDASIFHEVRELLGRLR